MPGVDSRLLVTPQHTRHFCRDLSRLRCGLLKQPTEDLPDLWDRHRRGFPPRLGSAPTPRTTTPTAPRSCDGANPPNSGPRNEPSRLPPWTLPTPTRSRTDAPAPGPTPSVPPP